MRAKTVPDASADASSTPRPVWRGGLHAVAFVVAGVLGVPLIAAVSGLERVAAVVYLIGSMGLFGVSAAYHRRRWSLTAARRMKQLDHVMIFVAIAGNYTIFFALAVNASANGWLTFGAWLTAVCGTTVKLRRLHEPGGRADLWYLGLGWFGLLAWPWLLPVMTPARIAVVVGGGVLYTIGAVVLGARRPDPSPAVFGYHEVGHALMLAGAGLHYVLYLGLARV